MDRIEQKVLGWNIENFIEKQECKTCRLIKECDRYETLVGYETGRYENICDILSLLTEEEGL